jgi:hypothetical protein
MNVIDKKILLDCVRGLSAVDCKFAIIDGEGNKYGDLEIAAPQEQRKRQRPQYPWGTLIKYLRPYLDNLDAVGKTVSIPFGEYNPYSLCSTLSSWGTRTYGVGSVKHTMITTEQRIEVKRI